MSIEQLAIDTKIPRASIEALEEDRFGALPGPVFVKGFFRCCARSLELDPETVLSLLHEHERALQQLKSGRRERQAPHLLGRTTPPSPAAARPARASQTPAHSSAPASSTASTASTASTTSASASMPSPPAAAAGGNAAVAVAAPPSLFNFDAVLPRLRHTLAKAANGLRGTLGFNTRLLMWIAIGLMIAVIVMSAFVMVGGPTPTPRS